MRNATLKDLGIRWWYWLIPVAFGAAGVGALASITLEPETRDTLAACGTFFSAISLLAFLWPVLRIRERQGAEFAGTPSRRIPYRGTFLPASRVKLIIGLVGGSIIGAAALLAALFADEAGTRFKGGLCFVVFVGFLVVFLRATIARKAGILLTDDGILWNDWFFTTGLIPWLQIADARVYAHRERYSSTPSFGLRVRELNSLRLSRNARRKLTEQVARHGWHCYYHAESLLVPLSVVEETVKRYREHPELRWELTTGTALDRIVDFRTSQSRTDSSTMS